MEGVSDWMTGQMKTNEIGPDFIINYSIYICVCVCVVVCCVCVCCVVCVVCVLCVVYTEALTHKRF